MTRWYVSRSMLHTPTVGKAAPIATQSTPPLYVTNGGVDWVAMGAAFPTVGVWSMDLDTYHRVIAAGTHGRGAFRIQDTSNPVPALVLSKEDAGVPVGPSSSLDYT